METAFAFLRSFRQKSPWDVPMLLASHFLLQYALAGTGCTLRTDSALATKNSSEFS